jgi:DNA-binding IclR family transcriptional regulator
MVRGRPRETSDLPEIAADLERGIAISRIAEARGTSHSTIQRRIRTMREMLVEATGDAAWLLQATTVEVARGWLERFAPDAEGPPGRLGEPKSPK